MRLPLHNVSHPRHRQAGSAVIVVLALLVIIMIYIAGNLRTLNSLDRELKLIERQQVRRLQKAGAAANSPPAAIIITNAVPKPSGD